MAYIQYLPKKKKIICPWCVSGGAVTYLQGDSKSGLFPKKKWRLDKIYS